MVKNDRTRVNEGEANRFRPVGSNVVCCPIHGRRGHAHSLAADYRFPTGSCGKWESQLEELVAQLKTG